MDTLLVAAIVLITLAVITQAGVLVAMYLMSRRLSEKAEALMNDSRKLMAPLESITNSLRAAADDLAETGRIAHQQAVHIQGIVAETQQSIRAQVADAGHVIFDTMREARGIVMRPLRHYSAIATGIAEGLRAFLFGRTQTGDGKIRVEKQHPAA